MRDSSFLSVWPQMMKDMMTCFDDNAKSAGTGHLTDWQEVMAEAELSGDRRRETLEDLINNTEKQPLDHNTAAYLQDLKNQMTANIDLPQTTIPCLPTLTYRMAYPRRWQITNPSMPCH